MMLFYACTIFFTVMCESLPLDKEYTPNVGTVLFNTHDMLKKQWGKSEIGLLKARRYFQNLLPPPVFIKGFNEDQVSILLGYFRDAYASIKKEAKDPETDTILTTALSDAVGGYFKEWILPIAKLDYYGGTISQANVIKLFQFYNEIKRYLDTDGEGWRKPNEQVLNAMTINVAPIQLLSNTRSMKDPCDRLAYFEKTPTGLSIPIPNVNWNNKSSTMFVPLKNASLITMNTPDLSHNLLKYYDAARSCIQSSNPRDQQNFDEKFQSWLVDDVVPHLKDDNLYLALGSVLTLVNRTQKLCNNVMDVYLDKYNVKHKKFNTSPAQDVTEISCKKLWIIVIILLIEVAWCIPALIYILCSKKFQKKDCSSNIYLFIDNDKNKGGSAQAQTVPEDVVDDTCCMSCIEDVSAADNAALKIFRKSKFSNTEFTGQYPSCTTNTIGTACLSCSKCLSKNQPSKIIDMKCYATVDPKTSERFVSKKSLLKKSSIMTAQQHNCSTQMMLSSHETFGSKPSGVNYFTMRSKQCSPTPLESHQKGKKRQNEYTTEVRNHEDRKKTDDHRKPNERKQSDDHRKSETRRHTEEYKRPEERRQAVGNRILLEHRQVDECRKHKGRGQAEESKKLKERRLAEACKKLEEQDQGEEYWNPENGAVAREDWNLEDRMHEEECKKNEERRQVEEYWKIEEQRQAEESRKLKERRQSAEKTKKIDKVEPRQQTEEFEIPIEYCDPEEYRKLEECRLAKECKKHGDRRKSEGNVKKTDSFEEHRQAEECRNLAEHKLAEEHKKPGEHRQSERIIAAKCCNSQVCKKLEERREAEEKQKLEECRKLKESKQDGGRKLEDECKKLEQRKLEQECKKLEELKLEAECKKIEELKQAEEKRKLEERRLEEEYKKLEERKKAEERRKLEERRLIEECRRLKERKQAEEQRKLEERKLEEKCKKLEERIQAEENRKLEERRKAEECRQFKERKQAEERKLAEEAKKLEECRKAEQKRKLEECKQAEEKRKLEECRKAEEKRKLEECKQAEEKRKLEECKQLKENKKLEECRKHRQVDESRNADDCRKLTEFRKLDEQKQLDELKKLDELRKLEECRKLQERKKLEECKRRKKAELCKNLEELKELEESRVDECKDTDENLDINDSREFEECREFDESTKPGDCIQCDGSCSDAIATPQVQFADEVEDDEDDDYDDTICCDKIIPVRQQPKSKSHKADSKNANSKKADSKKADCKKADSKKADCKKAESKKDDFPPPMCPCIECIETISEDVDNVSQYDESSECHLGHTKLRDLLAKQGEAKATRFQLCTEMTTKGGSKFSFGKQPYLEITIDRPGTEICVDMSQCRTHSPQPRPSKIPKPSSCNIQPTASFSLGKQPTCSSPTDKHRSLIPQLKKKTADDMDLAPCRCLEQNKLNVSF